MLDPFYLSYALGLRRPERGGQEPSLFDVKSQSIVFNIIFRRGDWRIRDGKKQGEREPEAEKNRCS